MLFLVSIYVLFYVTLTRSSPRTVIISENILRDFEQLYLEHGKTLSCPCSVITMPYQAFVSNKITLHSVCSSIFISSQWTKALYLPDASRYGVADFRTTASSQVNQYRSHTVKKDFVPNLYPEEESFTVRVVFRNLKRFRNECIQFFFRSADSCET